MRKFVPERITRRRDQLRLTQMELAKRIGLAREQLVRIERGHSIPRADTLANLANALRVRVDYFFEPLDKNANT